MKPVTYVMFGLVLLLQYPLWFGSSGALASWRLNQEISAQKTENARLLERNRALQAEVINLKSGLDAIEERARAELGMVKRDETFYQVIEPRQP